MSYDQPKINFDPPNQPVDLCEDCQKSDDWALICIECLEKLRKENEELNKAYESLVFIGGQKLVAAIYQCCECEIEIKDIRVVIPEKNEIWCVECFYKNWKIIK